MSQDITGRCLCGAVTFTARADNLNVTACHCGMCQQWSAGPFLSLEGVRDVRFTAEDNIGVYESSRWGERGFCKRCGSLLYWKLVKGDRYEVSAGALHAKEGLSLIKEIYVDDKPAYYDFANETRKLTGAETIAENKAAAMTGAEPLRSNESKD